MRGRRKYPKVKPGDQRYQAPTSSPGGMLTAIEENARYVACRYPGQRKTDPPVQVARWYWHEGMPHRPPPGTPTPTKSRLAVLREYRNVNVALAHSSLRLKGLGLMSKEASAELETHGRLQATQQALAWVLGDNAMAPLKAIMPAKKKRK